MTNLIGQSLGRYHILEQLGEGGMATVYKAYDTKLERHVAIKVIHPQKQAAEKFVKRFDREAKALAQLSHSNIVRVVDYGEQDGAPFLVMEYVSGGTLKQKLAGRPIPWRDALKIILPLAQALSTAHKQGIIHRDVKSSNILISKNGEPLLSDFGVARMIEVEETLELTGTGVGVGTPEYMSPEQAQGRPADVRSDIYSLGVVLYEMVTGRKPFQAETPMAVIWKLASEPLPRPRQFVTTLPEEVEGLLLKALARSPRDRFPDMDAFALAGERILGGQVSGLPKGSWMRWGLGILALGILGIAVWFALPRGTTEVPPLITAPSSTFQSETGAATPVRTEIQTASPSAPFFPFTASFDESGAVDGTVWREQYKPPCRYTQQDGFLLIDNDASTLDVDCLLTVWAPTPILGGTFSAFEGRIRMGSDHNGVKANQGLYLTTDSVSGGSWWAFCGVEGSRDGVFLLMDVTNYGSGREPDLHQYGEAQYDKWYKVRIEVDWNTMEFRCLVDDRPFASVIPSDSKELAGARFRFRLDAWRTPGSFVSSGFDDISIEP